MLWTTKNFCAKRICLPEQACPFCDSRSLLTAGREKELFTDSAEQPSTWPALRIIQTRKSLLDELLRFPSCILQFQMKFLLHSFQICECLLPSLPSLPFTMIAKRTSPWNRASDFTSPPFRTPFWWQNWKMQHKRSYVLPQGTGIYFWCTIPKN